MESRRVGRVWDQALGPFPCPVCWLLYAPSSGVCLLLARRLCFGVVTHTNTLNFCLKRGGGFYSQVFCSAHLEKSLEFCLVICDISSALV